MFKNAFQSGFLSILYSIGSKPLHIWEKQVKICVKIGVEASKLKAHSLCWGLHFALAVASRILFVLNIDNSLPRFEMDTLKE